MIAVDTNVLIYRIDPSQPVKHAKAKLLLRALRSSKEGVLLWQVAGELLRFLRFWQDQSQITRHGVIRYAVAFRKLLPIVMPTPDVLERALDLTGRYSLSHWDSMLLGACIEAGVTKLYTEDMGAPKTYDTVHLINPFV